MDWKFIYFALNFVLILAINLFIAFDKKIADLSSESKEFAWTFLDEYGVAIKITLVIILAALNAFNAYKQNRSKKNLEYWMLKTCIDNIHIRRFKGANDLMSGDHRYRIALFVPCRIYRPWKYKYSLSVEQLKRRMPIELSIFGRKIQISHENQEGFVEGQEAKELTAFEKLRLFGSKALHCYYRTGSNETKRRWILSMEKQGVATLAYKNQQTIEIKSLGKRSTEEYCEEANVLASLNSSWPGAAISATPIISTTGGGVNVLGVFMIEHKADEGVESSIAVDREFSIDMSLCSQILEGIQ